MFDEESVLTVLENLGVDVDSSTGTDYLCYCPFHSNRVTPSFAVSKVEGVYICFNPGCDVKGSLYRLVAELGNMNPWEAARFIDKYNKPISTEVALNKILTRTTEDDEFDLEIMRRMQRDLATTPKAMEYLYSRGLSDETIGYFQLGYSGKRGMVVIPVYTRFNKLLGIVGRSIEGKAYKNSKGASFSKTLFNIQKAIRASDTVAIVEGAFDAMRVHEAGYPCVVATLGGHLSKEQTKLLDAYFNRIIIMTDADGPGRDLGKKIMRAVPGKLTKWAVHPDHESGVYNGYKDAGDMPSADIQACIDNAMTTLEVRREFGVKL